MTRKNSSQFLASKLNKGTIAYLFQYISKRLVIFEETGKIKSSLNLECCAHMWERNCTFTE